MKKKEKGKEKTDIKKPKDDDIPINEFKIIFLGDAGVGAKTTLINRIMGEKFNEDEHTTSTCSFTQKHVDIGNNEELILDLWDTIGQEEYRRLVIIFLNNIDCVVLGYDVTNKFSFEAIKDYWYPKIKELNLCNLIYLIGNQIDLVDKREVSKEEAIKYAESVNLRFFEISCKTKEGLNIFYNDLVNQILELYIAKT